MTVAVLTYDCIKNIWGQWQQHLNRKSKEDFQSAVQKPRPQMLCSIMCLRRRQLATILSQALLLDCTRPRASSIRPVIIFFIINTFCPLFNIACRSFDKTLMMPEAPNRPKQNSSTMIVPRSSPSKVSAMDFHAAPALEAIVSVASAIMIDPESRFSKYIRAAPQTILVGYLLVTGHFSGPIHLLSLFLMQMKPYLFRAIAFLSNISALSSSLEKRLIQIHSFSPEGSQGDRSVLRQPLMACSSIWRQALVRTKRRLGKVSLRGQGANKILNNCRESKDRLFSLGRLWQRGDSTIVAIFQER